MAAVGYVGSGSELLKLSNSLIFVGTEWTNTYRTENYLDGSSYGLIEELSSSVWRD